MFRTIQCSLMILGLAGVFATAGCISSTPPAPTDEHGHDHDHEEEAHIHGPHNGPVFKLKGEEELYAEWLKEGESGLVTIYIVDHEGKQEVPVVADKVTITITTKKPEGDEITPYELLAVNPTEGDMPKASRFELTDKTLETSLSALAPNAIEAKLTATLNGKPYEAAIERDDHH